MSLAAVAACNGAVRHALLASVTILAWLAAVSPASAAPKVGERVAVTACPYRGVVATCTMIAGADGTVFNISGATPLPRFMGRVIWLRGTVTDKASMCGQGLVLD